MSKSAKTRGKIGAIIGTVAFWTAAILAVALAVAAVALGRNRTTPPFVFGRAVLWVETGSMQPEIPAESFILVAESDGSDVNRGDVITFLCTDEKSKAYGLLVTHRVIEVVEDGYRTKGDASVAADGWTVKPAEVKAVYRRNMPVLTFFGKLFKSPLGITAILLVFAISSAALYVPDIVNAIRGDEDERKKREFDCRVAEEVERLKNENPTGSDETKPEITDENPTDSDETKPKITEKDPTEENGKRE